MSGQHPMPPSLDWQGRALRCCGRQDAPSVSYLLQASRLASQAVHEGCTAQLKCPAAIASHSWVFLQFEGVQGVQGGTEAHPGGH